MEVQTVFRFNVGAIPCAVIRDTSGPLSREELTQIYGAEGISRFEQAGADLAAIIMSTNILTLESGGKRVLIDTGIGGLDPNDPGQLHAELETAGITPEQVDVIIISHFHGDHIGGLLDKDGKKFFPNARLIVPEVEYNHWMSEAVFASIPPPRQQLLTTTFDAYRDQLTLWSGEGEIVPGVRYVSALGHTPGHQAIMVESNGERFLHMVDAIHTPMQVILPDVVPRFDSRPEVAVQTRQDLIARVLSEHLRIMTYHFAFPGIGTITQGEHSPIFKPEV